MSKRINPNILILGTPGVGKTTICKILEEKSGLKHIEVSRCIQEHKLYTHWDDDLDCSIFNEKLVNKFLKAHLNNGGCIIDFHACDFLKPKHFDFIFVLSVDNTILYNRLEIRGYSQSKIKENIECEIFQVIFDSTLESFDKEKVVRLQNDTKKHMKRNVEYIMSKIQPQDIKISNHPKPSKTKKRQNSNQQPPEGKRQRKEKSDDINQRNKG